MDDKFAEKASLLKPSSGLKSKEDDDGAKVALVDPTGKGATGISVSEDADVL